MVITYESDEYTVKVLSIKDSRVTLSSRKIKTRPVSIRGFTIVELLIVVVVIAILAAITIVVYNGISNRAKESAAQSAVSQAAKKIMTFATTNSDQYPADLTTAGVVNSGGTTYGYSVNNTVSPKTFCVTATVSSVSYYVSSTNSSPSSGSCPVVIADGSLMQTITSANCPTGRIRAVDARDNRTYWVQKLADNKCWMLTNLAYAGDGINTYGDAKTLSNGTGDSSTTYTVGKYYVHGNANPTTEPTLPSASTDGGATNPQYGYLYNWCAAMGIQSGTNACLSATTPASNANISICPAGWRVPTGNGGELSALNTAVNGGLLNTDAGLRTVWLGQRSGNWSSLTFNNQGSYGYYWSSTQNSTFDAYLVYFGTSNVNTYNNGKYNAFSVRCIAT